MKVMVCLKQVPHQDARLDVNADGTWIKEDSIKFEINSYDTYALEEALRIKDAGEAEVVVKVCDFGVAKRTSTADGGTVTWGSSSQPSLVHRRPWESVLNDPERV